MLAIPYANGTLGSPCWRWDFCDGALVSSALHECARWGQHERARHGFDVGSATDAQISHVARSQSTWAARSRFRTKLLMRRCALCEFSSNRWNGRNRVSRRSCPWGTNRSVPREAKLRVQGTAVAAGINLRRVYAWWQGVPRATTRTAQFARLPLPA